MTTDTIIEHDVMQVDLQDRPARPLAHLQPPATHVAAHSATPADLVRMAVESGADLDKLERLMALQERWEAAQAKKAYDEAFAAFKAEAVRIIKNRAMTDGPMRGSQYAELFVVVNAATPALSKHGLSSSWKLTRDDRDWIEVTCMLKHVGGHMESVSMGGPPDTTGAKNSIQARASTVSYLERYTFKAVTGLSEQRDDDDGHGSGAPSGKPSPIDAARKEWIDKATAAKSEGHLRSVMRDGVKVFQAARDMQGYGLFAAAVQTRGAALKKSQDGQQHE